MFSREQSEYTFNRQESAMSTGSNAPMPGPGGDLRGKESHSFRLLRSYYYTQQLPKQVTQDLLSVMHYFSYQFRFRSALAVLAVCSLFFTTIQLEEVKISRSISFSKHETLKACCVTITTIFGLIFIYRLYLAKTLRMSVFGTTLMRHKQRRSARQPRAESDSPSHNLTASRSQSPTTLFAPPAPVDGSRWHRRSLSANSNTPTLEHHDREGVAVDCEMRELPPTSVREAVSEESSGHFVHHGRQQSELMEYDIRGRARPKVDTRTCPHASLAQVAAQTAYTVSEEEHWVPLNGVKLVIGSPHFVPMLIEMATWLIHQPPFLSHYWSDAKALDFFVLLRVYSVLLWARNATLGSNTFCRIMSYFAGIPLDSFFFMRVVFIRYPWMTPVVLCFGSWVTLAVIYSYVEHVSVAESLYFIIVTASTIGYGDITPKTARGKAIVLMTWLFGCVLVGWVVVQVHTMLRLSPREEAFFNLLEFNHRTKKVENLAAVTIQVAFKVYKAEGLSRTRLFWRYNNSATIFRKELREFRAFVAAQPEGSVVRRHERSRAEENKMQLDKAQDTRYHKLENRMLTMENKMDKLLSMMSMMAEAQQNGNVQQTPPSSASTTKHDGADDDDDEQDVLPSPKRVMPRRFNSDQQPPPPSILVSPGGNDHSSSQGKMVVSFGGVHNLGNSANVRSASLDSAIADDLSSTVKERFDVTSSTPPSDSVQRERSQFTPPPPPNVLSGALEEPHASPPPPLGRTATPQEAPLAPLDESRRSSETNHPLHHNLNQRQESDAAELLDAADSATNPTREYYES